MMERDPLLITKRKDELDLEKRKTSRHLEEARLKRQQQDKERWKEIWRHLDKQLYKEAYRNGQLKRGGIAWGFLGWVISLYSMHILKPLWFFSSGGLFMTHLVATAIESLLIVAIWECVIRAENTRRHNAELPPVPSVWTLLSYGDWTGWRLSLTWGTVKNFVKLMVVVIVSVIVLVFLSRVFDPLVLMVVFFLGYTLGLDFLFPTGIELIVLLVFFGGYIIFRNRLLKKRWLQWWEEHEKDVIRDIEGSNDGGRDGGGSSPH